VPALDFGLMAQRLAEADEAEKAEQQRALEPKGDLPENWTTAVSRSTGQVYYVNSVTGATQYEFPEKVASAWGAYGAMMIMGSKGLTQKSERRNSL
jgi:hypothetical protein